MADITATDEKLAIRTNLIKNAIRIVGYKDTPIIEKRSNDYNLSSREITDEHVNISSLGSPVYSNFQIQQGNYEDANGNTITYASNNFVLDTVLYTLNRIKRIVKTPVVGLEGDVKEMISKGDYAITIEGLLIGPDGNSLKEKLRQLLLIESADKDIVIQSNYLGLYGITNIVIEQLSTKQMPGNRNTIAFTINAVSDKPIELTVVDNA